MEREWEWSQTYGEERGRASRPLTCPVAGAVEVHGEGVRLVVGLPGGRRAVLVVGVGVVVVDIPEKKNNQ